MMRTRAQEHLDEVRRRLRRSRYDDDTGELDRLLARFGSDSPCVRRLPGPPLPSARLLPPTALRVATEPLDHERSAEVLSAVLAEDLSIVRRHLGSNVRQVDGASTLLAVRWSENVVGTLMLVLTEDATGTVAGLHALAVASPFRRRGIGQALATRALELATGAGADLAVTTAPFLDRLGFEPVPVSRGSE